MKNGHSTIESEVKTHLWLEPNSVEKHLKFHSQTNLGMPIRLVILLRLS